MRSSGGRLARYLSQGVRRLKPRPAAPLAFLPAPDDHYKTRFLKSADAFSYFMQQCRLPRRRPAGAAAGIVIMPWTVQPTPWYSMLVALGLAQQGRAITLIWNDIPFPAPSREAAFQNEAIERVLAQAPPCLHVVRLSQENARPLTAVDQGYIDQMAGLNVTWQLKAGDLGNSEAAQSLRQSYQAGLMAAQPFVRAALTRLPLAYSLVPGGIFSSSGLFMLTGHELQQRVASYDYGPDTLSLCTDGIAAHQADIPQAFEAMQRASQQDQERAIAIAKHEFEARVHGRDRTNFQMVGSAGRGAVPQSSVLIPLNVDWDSSALGCHHIFPDTLEWLRATVALVLQNSNLPVIVRQHPAERNEVSRSSADLSGLLQADFGDNPRFRFVQASEAVSTYDLLETATVVLPYVSTLGIEAAALGKPVIVSGRSYYSNLGIVWAPTSRAEYMDLVLKGLAGQLPPLPQQSNNAWLCYYLTQACNRLWTHLTPTHSDFWSWVVNPPVSVLRDPVQQDVLKALDTGTAIALVRHQRRVAEIRIPASVE